MSKRAREKRIAETSAEFEEQLSRVSAQDVVASRPDEVLFVVDRTGSKSARRRVLKEETAKARNQPVSKTDRALLKKRAEKAKQQVALGLPSKPVREQPSVLADLWADESSATQRQPRIKRSSTVASAAKKVAGPGFSYNPPVSAHQNVLAEALALEIKKREKDMRNSKAITLGLSELTKSVLIDSDYDSDEEDEDEDGGGEGEGGSRKRKIKDKKTRAQRNKERKRKDIDSVKALEQMERGVLKSIDSLPHILRSLDAREKKAQALKALREVQALSAKDETALTYEEAGAVPLSDELGGSLRRVVPKGSSLNSAVTKVRQSGGFLMRDKFNRKKGDTLHATKKVKWVAKYKYT